jgi:hypothetical protein
MLVEAIPESVGDIQPRYRVLVQGVIQQSRERLQAGFQRRQRRKREWCAPACGLQVQTRTMSEACAWLLKPAGRWVELPLHTFDLDSNVSPLALPSGRQQDSGDRFRNSCNGSSGKITFNLEGMAHVLRKLRAGAAASVLTEGSSVAPCFSI